MFTVLHPLMLLAAAVWVIFFKKEEGRIMLPPDEESDGPRENGRERPAREFDANDWS